MCESTKVILVCLADYRDASHFPAAVEKVEVKWVMFRLVGTPRCGVPARVLTGGTGQPECTQSFSRCAAKRRGRRKRAVPTKFGLSRTFRLLYIEKTASSNG